MNLSDIYICALKRLDGFDEDNILKAIELATNDIVETLDDFTDFINFNIEDNRFNNITRPIKEEIIKKAVEKTLRNKDSIVHYVNATDDIFPKRLPIEYMNSIPLLKYKGKLENLKRKTILITGSPSVSNNARLASEYIGKVLASKGYNILSSFSNECEKNAIKGCKEARGVSTFFLPHSIEHLTSEEKDDIQNELDSERSVIMSFDDYVLANAKSIENACKFSTAIADCMIVPQISKKDNTFDYIKKFLASDKPVFLVKYKTNNKKEYDCIKALESLGVMYLSSNTVLKQIENTIGVAIDN